MARKKTTEAPETPPGPLRQWLDAHRARLLAHGCDDLIAELDHLATAQESTSPPVQAA